MCSLQESGNRLHSSDLLLCSSKSAVGYAEEISTSVIWDIASKEVHCEKRRIAFISNSAVVQNAGGDESEADLFFFGEAHQLKKFRVFVQIFDNCIWDLPFVLNY